MTTVLRRVHKKSQNITITIRLIASIIRIDYSGFCEYMNKGEPGRVSMEFRLELNANGWYKKGVWHETRWLFHWSDEKTLLIVLQALKFIMLDTCCCDVCTSIGGSAATALEKNAM